MQDPAAPIGTLGFDEAEAAKKREGLSKHQRTAADFSVVIRRSRNRADAEKTEPRSALNL